jgi:hypothetical protein
MRRSILTAVLLALAASAARAAVEHVPVKSNLVLEPGQAYTISVAATTPEEIGWAAVQPKPCTTPCVQATDITGGLNYTIALPLGGSMKYTPLKGTIRIEYRNVSTTPVTIDVYRVHRTCDAEACRFLDGHQTSSWLVFKVDAFKSIATSKDGSYSVISGVTTAGRPFTVTALWWTDDKKAAIVDCSPSVQKYLDNHTPRDQYRPYIISGQAVSPSAALVLKSIDTCAPKAPDFGVPDKHVFKP